MQSHSEEPTGIHLWLILMKAYRALEKHALGSIEHAGMCFSDFSVLEVLLHKGPMAVNAIGAKIRLTSGSITTAIDRLEARGLVERIGDPDDRRSRIVHLTANGRELIGPVFAEHVSAMQAAGDVLSVEERRTLITLLKKLGKSAEEL